MLRAVKHGCPLLCSCLVSKLTALTFLSPFVDMLPNSTQISDQSCMDIKVSLPDDDDLDNHIESQQSPLVDDDDAASDGVTDKSSLDEGDKKDGTGKKRKRRVGIRLTLLIPVYVSSFM